MTKRTFLDKNQNQWEWEETPETIQALKDLVDAVNVVNQKKEEANGVRVAD